MFTPYGEQCVRESGEGRKERERNYEKELAAKSFKVENLKIISLAFFLMTLFNGVLFCAKWY